MFILSKDEVGFVSVEVAISGIIALICFFGIALNASLVYVTVKSKSIHSKCSVLIALYAFFAIFLLIGFCVKIFIFLFGINFITLGTCFWIQFISRSACVMAIILQLCIGVERLMAVSFPIWYNMSGKYSVFKVLITISTIKVIADKCVDYYGSSMHWEKFVICELSDPANQPEIIGYTVYNTLIIQVAEVLCYAMLWLISWWRKGEQNNRWRCTETDKANLKLATANDRRVRQKVVNQDGTITRTSEGKERTTNGASGKRKQRWNL
ncbi:hypothetical protein niasHT_013796 [Heterodera trifolii]|uniref:G-protein coupled receptors family 1 profile domain-containing protein n=1 Tax=Heterodera trifolii TaxID=157864 RepID=A0ABD2KTM7_9BILA